MMRLPIVGRSPRERIRARETTRPPRIAATAQYRRALLWGARSLLQLQIKDLH